MAASDVVDPQGTPSIRRLASGDAESLFSFLGDIAVDSASRHFHPHPFTRAEAERIAGDQGLDIYLGMFDGDVILGYGMLRGWDEGYDVPSLGICLHPAARGRRLGASLMDALHRAAAERGAERVRLRVHPENRTATNLYTRLGYVYSGEQGGDLVGFLCLRGFTELSRDDDARSSTSSHCPPDTSLPISGSSR